MKKAFIIFAVLFALTLAIPAFAAFFNHASADSTRELATLFSGNISYPLNSHLFF